MEPRDVFDGALVFLIAVVVYVEVFGLGISRERVDALVEVLLGLDLAIYLVIAGLLGVAYVGYIAIVLPEKYGDDSVDRPR